MKYIVVGDTHIGIKKSSKKYHQVAISLFTDICKYARENGIKYLIQTGDLFDNRKALTHNSIECALEIGDMVSETFEETYFIVGNHDTSSKDTMFPHSLIIFNKYDNIEVIDEPFVTEDQVVMIPWLFDVDNMPNGNICIGHFDINGAQMNSAGTVSCNHRLKFSDFSKYELTLSGHYHTPGEYAYNVNYIGSPYQLTFNDIDSNRGFHILDTDLYGGDPNCLRFLPFVDYPKHISITDKTTTNTNIKGNIVRLTFTDDHGLDGNKEIIDKVRGFDPYSLRINYSRLDKGMTEEDIKDDISIKSKLEILNEFHAKSDLPEGINRVLLNKVSESIYKELMNV